MISEAWADWLHLLSARMPDERHAVVFGASSHASWPICAWHQAMQDASTIFSGRRAEVEWSGDGQAPALDRYWLVAAAVAEQLAVERARYVVLFQVSGGTL